MKEKFLTLEENKKEIQLIADALSSKTRISILEEIKKGKGDYSHRKLADEVGVKSSSITFHLASLNSAGLISEEDGKGLLGRKSKKPKITTKRIVINL